MIILYNWKGSPDDTDWIKGISVIEERNSFLCLVISDVKLNKIELISNQKPILSNRFLWTRNEFKPIVLQFLMLEVSENFHGRVMWNLKKV